MVKMNEPDLQFLMYQHTHAIEREVREMEMKTKRKIFATLRQINKSVNMTKLLFPQFKSLTLGQFATIQILFSDAKRNQLSRKRKQPAT